MPNRPAATELWWTYHSAIQEWIAASSKEGLSLAPATSALEDLLRYYPTEAANVQKLAVSGTYMARCYHRVDGVRQFARVGVDAALLRKMESEEEMASATMLALLGAEAHIDLRELLEGQRLLDDAEAIAEDLHVSGPLGDYISVHRHHIHGTFAEVNLEASLAAESFAMGMQVGMPLLLDVDTTQVVAREVAQMLFGDIESVVESGDELSSGLLRADLVSTVSRVVLGYSRTTQTAQVDAARAAVDFCKRFGLPGDCSPIDLRPALLSLPAEELETVVNELEHLTEPFDTRQRAAWLTMLRSTLGTVMAAEGRERQAHTAFQRAGTSMRDCFDAITLAVATGDLLTTNAESPTQPVADGLLRAFRVALYHVIAGAQDSPDLLRIRAHLDAPISAAVEHAFDAYLTDDSGANRRMLSMFIDAVRSPQQNLLLDDPQPGSIEAGLADAYDRLQRLHFAIQQVPDTAAVVVQTVRNHTLFICVTGEAQNPFILKRAGPAYAKTARALAQEQHRLIHDRVPDGDAVLAKMGRQVHAALPEEVQDLLRRRSAILFAPDFHADLDNVPFELWHDGKDFLGLSKVISRFVSLRDMVRSLETPLLRPHTQNRALCIAAPDVPGFAPLYFAKDEVLELSDILAEEGWEVYDLADLDIDPNFLLLGAEHADVLHFAAHGQVYAGYEAVVLPNGLRMTVADIEGRTRTLQSMVFLNACSLGRSRYLGGGVSRGIAYALSRAGAPCVIASQLPIEDLGALHLCLTVYEEARSDTIGEALRRARNRVVGKVPAAIWGATILVGDAFHRLPFGDNAPTRPHADVTTRLLDSYTSPNATEDDRSRAFLAARDRYREHAGDQRLAAAITWILQGNQVDSESPDMETIELLAQLADEIGHPAGKALYLVHRAQNDDPDALDDAISALESLRAHSDFWYRVYMDCLTRRQRLKIREEPKPILSGPIRVNDPDDPAVQAILGIQYAVDEEEERKRGPILPIQPERDLFDFSWNAIILGSENRFPDAYADSWAVALLSDKLVRFTKSAEARTFAARILGGLLPYFWSTQRVTHLDRARARAQAGALKFALLEALEDADQRNATLERFAPVADLLEQMMGVVEDESENRYARALQAIRKPAAAGAELSEKTIVKILDTLPEDLIAEGTAWVLGELLHAYGILQMSGRKGSATTVRMVHDQILDRADSAFFPYLQEGYGVLQRDPYAYIGIWQATSRQDTDAASDAL